MKRQIILLPVLAIGGLSVLSACAGKGDASYPIGPHERRQEARGKLSGEGLVLFDPERKSSGGGNGGGGPSIGVNRYLWQATLDTFAFMPLASADPFGGVIITDWYEDPQAAGERFKATIVISDRDLRADAVHVRLFKQRKSANGEWRDASLSDGVATNMENAILTRARELWLKREN